MVALAIAGCTATVAFLAAGWHWNRKARRALGEIRRLAGEPQPQAPELNQLNGNHPSDI